MRFILHVLKICLLIAVTYLTAMVVGITVGYLGA